MLTLTYGYKKPETNDKGNIFWPALEFNITQLDSHNHDGVNSALIAASSVAKTAQTIDAVDWVATTGGRFRQEITLPPGLTYLNIHMTFVITGGPYDGELLTPTIGAGSAANKYFIYTNDNTLDLTAIYV